MKACVYLAIVSDINCKANAMTMWAIWRERGSLIFLKLILIKLPLILTYYYLGIVYVLFIRLNNKATRRSSLSGAHRDFLR